MKLKLMTIAVFLMAAQAFGQQSTTDTNCTTSPDYGAGRTTNCTSTTNTEHPHRTLNTEPPPSGGLLAGVDKALAANRAKAEANRNQNAQSVQQASQLSPEAIKELIAEEKQEREAKDAVDFIYCRQNPKGGITDSEGKLKSCADVIEYTKAFCSVNPEVERCTLAKSKGEVEKAFAAVINEYNSNKHRDGKWEQGYYHDKFTALIKWGCMSFPDMILPLRDGATHPCPNAPLP